MGDRRRLQEGRLGVRAIPEIAFEIGDLGGGDHRLVDVVRPELDAGAEIGRHGALRVRRHQHQAARGRRTGCERRRPELDPGRADVVAEHLAELIALHLADVGRLPPSEATPAMVLAQEPPDISTAGPICA